MSGWIKIHRQLIDWGWYKDVPTKVLFLHLILRAQFQSSEFRGEKIERGQLITGRVQLSQETGLSVQSVRTALNHLISTSEITIKTFNKFSIITVLKYNDYQIDNQQNNQQLTNNQPTTNHIQEGKKERRKEIIVAKATTANAEQKEYGKNELNILFSEMEKITGRPRISGQMQRNHAASWTKQIASAYPSQDCNKLACSVIKMAIELGDNWHTPKAHDFYHLRKNWQEIAAKWKILKSKSPNSAVCQV